MTTVHSRRASQRLSVVDFLQRNLSCSPPHEECLAADPALRGWLSDPRPVVLGFSGGVDSLGLLTALARLVHRPLVAVHVDHGMDSGSAARAAAAASLVEQVTALAATTAPLHFERREVQVTASMQRSAGGLEAAARSLRYQELLHARDRWQATHVMTAHHVEDQLETIALRIGQGTGLFGLAAIEPARGPVLRPLLPRSSNLLAPRKADLQKLVCEAGLEALVDPTNADLGPLRNRFRHQLLPRLTGRTLGSLANLISLGPASGPAAQSAAQPELRDSATADTEQCAHRVALATQRLRTRFEQWARQHLELRTDGAESSIALAPWLGLPPRVRRLALQALHRSARGAFHQRHHDAPEISAAPPRRAVHELERQLALHRSSGAAAAVTSLGNVQVDCGGGWRWSIRRRAGSRLVLAPRTAAEEEGARSRSQPSQGTGSFAYTCPIPGSTKIPECRLILHIKKEPFDPWMLKRWPDRTALFISGERLDSCTITVRGRRPGDTINPIHHPSKRLKLKKLFIDRKIPRARRATIPIVCINSEVAWVPGYALSQEFALPTKPHEEPTQDTKPEATLHSNQLVWTLHLEPIDVP